MGKKKKKKAAAKEIKKPELSSYLRSLIKKEGESIDLQCRLEEEMEEGECKVQWFLNDTELEESDEFVMSFDGTYAKLFIASCTMDHMGSFKCVFSNEAGTDETAGKVTVKPDENKKKEATPPKQIPYSQRKKSSAAGEGPGAANGAEGAAEGEMFKMPKKKSVARKPIEKKEEEVPAFAGMKLKKSERVQRKRDDGGLETVDLKHHEFEKEPLEEGPELTSETWMTERMPDDDGKKKKKKKKK